MIKMTALELTCIVLMIQQLEETMFGSYREEVITFLTLDVDEDGELEKETTGMMDRSILKVCV